MSKSREETRKVLDKVGTGIGTTGNVNIPLLPKVYCKEEENMMVFFSIDKW